MSFTYVHPTSARHSSGRRRPRRDGLDSDHLTSSPPDRRLVLPRLLHRSRIQIPQIHLRTYFPRSGPPRSVSLADCSLLSSVQRLPSLSGGPIDSSEQLDSCGSIYSVDSSPSRPPRSRLSLLKATSLAPATLFDFDSLPPPPGLLSSELEDPVPTFLSQLLASRSTSPTPSRAFALSLACSHDASDSFFFVRVVPQHRLAFSHAFA